VLIKLSRRIGRIKNQIVISEIKIINYEATITFIRKEFYHVLRDRRVLLMLFGLPIVQVILFGFALSTEIKNTGIAVFDQDKSAVSSALVSKINTNKYFDIDRNLTSSKSVSRRFQRWKSENCFGIPSDFSENLSLQKKQIFK
jgi:ABC-2 type transport system permease protein